MTKISAALAFLAVGVGSAYAQAYCSLTIRIVDGADKPVPQVALRLEEAGGRVIQATARNGEFNACDLGVLPVTVTVGSSDCDRVTVENVPLGWQEPRALKIVYDIHSCPPDFPPGSLTCVTLLRFSDRDSGGWIPDVALDPPPAGASGISDLAGRLMLRIPFRQEIRARAVHVGYIPQEVHWSCDRTVTREEIIRLQRSK